jgi:hypothetical protein
MKTRQDDSEKQGAIFIANQPRREPVKEKKTVDNISYCIRCRIITKPKCQFSLRFLQLYRGCHHYYGMGGLSNYFGISPIEATFPTLPVLASPPICLPLSRLHASPRECLEHVRASKSINPPVCLLTLFSLCIISTPSPSPRTSSPIQITSLHYHDC